MQHWSLQGTVFTLMPKQRGNIFKSPKQWEQVLKCGLVLQPPNKPSCDGCCYLVALKQTYIFCFLFLTFRAFFLPEEGQSMTQKQYMELPCAGILDEKTLSKMGNADNPFGIEKSLKLLCLAPRRHSLRLAVWVQRQIAFLLKWWISENRNISFCVMHFYFSLKWFQA